MRIVQKARRAQKALLIASSLLALAAATPAEGAPFVARPLTLARSDWRLDLGLGAGHVDTGPDDATGLGVNLEAAYGLTSFLQLGLRTGLRLGDGGGRTGADAYGRLFETETYGTGGDDFANPEIGLKWALLYERVAELALDARVYLPLEDGTRFGFLLGLPLRLHLGAVTRLDTGVYVPVVLNDETDALVSVPLHLWVQLDDRMYAGLITGVRSPDEGKSQVPLGVAFGYTVSPTLDVESWLLFRDVKGDEAAKNFGLGVGVELGF